MMVIAIVTINALIPWYMFLLSCAYHFSCVHLRVAQGFTAGISDGSASALAAAMRSLLQTSRFFLPFSLVPALRCLLDPRRHGTACKVHGAPVRRLKIASFGSHHADQTQTTLMPAEE